MNAAPPATWALLLEAREGSCLGPLRRVPGLEVCARASELWLRGPEPDEAVRGALRALPASVRWAIDREGLLLPPGARLPVGKLPAGPWWPLGRWLQARLPEGERGPAPTPGPLPVHLVRVGPDDPCPAPELMRLPLVALAGWAEEASALRLARLSLAVDPGPPARALVRGEPLPPLAGERFVVAEGLAWPVGWAPRPRLDPGALALALGLLPGELALLDPQGGRETVPGGAFVPATRAAIRAACRPEVAGRPASGTEPGAGP